jgi:hypothetical protein
VPLQLGPAGLRPRVLLPEVDRGRLVLVPEGGQRPEVQAPPGVVVRPEERDDLRAQSAGTVAGSPYTREAFSRMIRSRCSFGNRFAAHEGES